MSGRPRKLTPDQVAELAKGIDARDIPVPELARSFRISVGTAYRYWREFEAAKGAPLSPQVRAALIAYRALQRASAAEKRARTVLHDALNHVPASEVTLYGDLCDEIDREGAASK